MSSKPINTGQLSAEDQLVFAMNVVMCVSIVMVNKQLMSKGGYGYVFATTLSGAHFIITGIATKLVKACRGQPSSPSSPTNTAALPLLDLVTFVVVANTSLVSLNVSLMINKVSMYQIAKLAIPIITAAVERVWFSNTYSNAQYAAMAVTLVGIANVSVDEFNVEGGASFGLFVAALSAVSSSMQQILCGHYQRKNNLSSQDFLAAVSLPQGLSCIALGPFVDFYITGRSVLEFDYTVPATSFILLSCFNAIFVNASHFMCLGRFSAVTYQVLGHTKTICVLFLGWKFFDGNLTEKQMMGGALAVAGMASYGYITQRSAVPKAKTEAEKPENADDVEAGTRGNAGAR